MELSKKKKKNSSVLLTSERFFFHTNRRGLTSLISMRNMITSSHSQMYLNTVNNGDIGDTRDETTISVLEQE